MIRDISIVIPIYNEQDNIIQLIKEVRAALEKKINYEIIIVDDGSDDNTYEAVNKIKKNNKNITIISHIKNYGQSVGLRTGITEANSEYIVTLDGDGQNDPADIPKLLEAFNAADDRAYRMVTGHRVNRRDSLSKRIGSRLANWVRSRLLNDANPDTGCALKLFEREMFLRLPYFDHMHRFLPALAKRAGCHVTVVPVNHRGRLHGQSKYSNFGRLIVGIPDLLGVAWLMRRAPRALDREEM